MSKRTSTFHHGKEMTIEHFYSHLFSEWEKVSHGKTEEMAAVTDCRHIPLAHPS